MAFKKTGKAERVGESLTYEQVQQKKAEQAEKGCCGACCDCHEDQAPAHENTPDTFRK